MTDARWDMANLSVVGTSTGTINTATTTNFDFGTIDDLNTARLSGFEHCDRLLISVLASTTGSTNTLTWSVQDADDNAGVIGTPATADTNVINGALAAGTGSDIGTLIAVKLKPGRPWVRVRFTSNGTTDTFATSCVAMGVPRGL